IGAVAVRFTLGGDGPASLDLVDVAGRRMAHKDLGAPGRGWHETSLARDSGLPPGVYTVRLVASRRSGTPRRVLTRRGVGGGGRPTSSLPVSPWGLDPAVAACGGSCSGYWCCRFRPASPWPRR